MADWDTGSEAYLAELASRGGARAPSTLGEVWSTEWRAAGLDTMLGQAQMLDEAYNDLESGVAKAGGKSVAELARETNVPLYQTVSPDERAAKLGEIVATFPEEDRLKLAPLVDIRARAADKAQAAERAAADTYASSYGLSAIATHFAANAARLAVDPMNLALTTLTAPIGGEGGAVLPFLGRQFLSGAAAQGLQEPAIEAGRANLGLDAGLLRGAENVAGAGIGTAGIAGLFRAAGAAVRLTGGRFAPKDFDAAAALAERNQIIDGLAPGADMAGRLTHDALLGDADRVINEGVQPREATDYQPGLKAQGIDAADALKRQWRQNSPIKTVEDLFAKAEDNQSSLAQAGASIADDVGVEFKNPGVKGVPRTLEKIAGGKAPAAINDVVRGGFVIEKPAQADAIVAQLAQRFEVADEGWAVTAAGYFDRKIIVRFPNGQGGEIQLWHPDLLRGKEHGHKLYVEARSLAPDDPRLPALMEQQKAIYDDALEAAGPEWKALLGKGGSDGNLASNASLDSTRASIPASAEWTRTHEPSRTDQASPGVQSTGSPSMVAKTGAATSEVGDEVKAASTENIGIPASEVKPLGNPQLAADAERALAAHGDMTLEFDNPDGTVRRATAAEEIAAAQEDARAANELIACLGGLVEEE